MKIEKIELKHLVGYLPYGLLVSKEGNVNILKALNTDMAHKARIQTYDRIADEDWVKLKDIKPLLRHLSDLTEEIEHDGEKFVPVVLIRNYGISKMECTNNDMDILLHYIHVWEDKTKCPYWVFEILHILQFDIHGLIEAGLAIDINTLKQ